LKVSGVQQVLVACPFLFCGWLAFNSRIYKDSFEVQCGTQDQDARVFAYEPYVSEESLLLESNHHSVERARVLSLACRWDDAVHRGQLQPLSPVSFEDNCTEGVRGDIFRAKSQIVSYLLDDAGRLINKHCTCDAVDEVLLAVRLSQSLKYGDLDSISATSVEERDELSFLSSRASLMCEKSRKDVLDEMTNLSHEHTMMLATTQATSARFYDYQERFRGNVGVSEIRQTAMLERRMREEGRVPKTLNMVRKNYLSDNDDAGLEYLCSLKLAWRSEDDIQRRANGLVQRITELRA
jgi:hypothetical protein